MKINIELSSNFFTDEQNQYCFDNPITIEWNYPSIPRKGDLFDQYSIMEELMPDYSADFCYVVDCVNWGKEGDEIIPTITLLGQ